MNTKAELKRRLSLLNAWAFSFACMIGWAAFVMPATVFLPRGGVAGSLLAFLLAAGAMSMIALNYHFLGNLHTRQGGIYHLVKASLNQDKAFAAGWSMGLAHMCCVSLNARAMGMLLRTILEEALDIRFNIYVFHTGIRLIDGFVIVAAIAGFGVIIARGMKQTANVQTAGAIVLLGGIVIMLIAAVLSANESAWKMEPAYAPGVGHTKGFFSIFILTPWAYVGFDSLSSVSEEVKFPIKKLGKIMVISVLCGTFAYVANIFITLLGMPGEYAFWTEYLAALKDMKGVDSYPVAIAARESMGVVGTVIFYAACISATLTGLVGFFTSISRLLFHMATDGSLPPVLAKVDPKRGTPANAVKAVVVVAFLLFLLLNTFNSIEELASVATAVGFGICSFAAMREAIQHKAKLYILSGIVGFGMCLVWLFFLLVPIPGVNTVISRQGMFFIAIWVFLGIGVYAFSKRRKIEI